MFRKGNRFSFFKGMITIAAVLAMTYSCSSAQTSSQKAAESKSSPTKSTAVKSINDSADIKKSAPKENHQLVVYYFMTTYRCPSCHYIEEMTKIALNENFSEQLKSGRMVFKMLNIEEPANDHFVKDYSLYTKSVVLSDQSDGKETRWTNLDKVWQLIRNDAGFKDYIVTQVKAYLGE
jgi:hypothetical protein